MKLIRFSTGIILSIVFVSAMLSISGCKKEDDKKVAPTLPPQSGFEMSFKDFSNSGDTLKSSLQMDTHNNWGYSYLNVAAWNGLLTVGLAVPVISYKEAFNHEAIYHPDVNNWTWSYNFSVGFTPYMAELTGAIEGDSTSWEMRITKAGAYASFLWYHGKAAISQSGGYWILIESPENPTNLLRINWNKFSDGTADIKYTNIKPGISENGSFIYYGTVLSSFDRFYQIYQKQFNNLTTIEWSSTLHNGHVKDPKHYQNNAWHCWDYSLQDVVCP